MALVLIYIFRFVCIEVPRSCVVVYLQHPPLLFLIFVCAKLCAKLSLTVCLALQVNSVQIVSCCFCKVGLWIQGRVMPTLYRENRVVPTLYREDCVVPTLYREDSVLPTLYREDSVVPTCPPFTEMTVWCPPFYKSATLR